MCGRTGGNIYRILGVELSCFVFYIFFNDFIFTGKEREGEGEKHASVVSHTPPTRDQATTQACALTRNRIGDLSICRMMADPHQLGLNEAFKTQYTLDNTSYFSDTYIFKFTSLDGLLKYVCVDWR